jgi:class 3 adenylate cyclase
MRFYAFTLCFFCSLFSVEAENKPLEPYLQNTYMLDEYITEAVNLFIPTSYTYQILTSNFIYSINIQNQNIYKKDRLSKQSQSLLNQEYSTEFKSNLMYQLLNEINFCENTFFANNYTPYSSTATMGKSGYAIRNDSLFHLHENAIQFIYYPVSKVYKADNTIYLWSKAGSLYEISDTRIIKRYSSVSKIASPDNLIKIDQHIFAIYNSPIKIVQLSKYQHKTIYENANSALNSIAKFDSKIFFLQKNGILNYININNANFNEIEQIELPIKAKAIANDKNGNLLILFADKIISYSIPYNYIIREHDYKQIFTTSNGYLALTQQNYLINNKGEKIGQSNIFNTKNFQIWKDENGAINNINENGILTFNKKPNYLLHATNLISSHYQSVYGYFWYLDKDSFVFANIANSRLNKISQFKNKSSIPQLIETDKVGNLWIICHDSVFFHSVNQTNTTYAITILNNTEPIFFSGKHNLLLYVNQNLYRCTLEGKLIQLKWKGDIDILPSTKLIAIQENNKNEWFGTCSSIKKGGITNVFKFRIINDIIDSKIIAQYKSKNEVTNTYESAPYAYLITNKEIITLNAHQFNYQPSNIYFFKKQNSYYINNNTISCYTNNSPSYIFFQHNNTEANQHGFYQIKFEPNDSIWTNYSENQIYPFHKLHKGIYKLHVRYCTDNGRILAQSTLLLNIEGNQWLQQKFLILYFFLFIVFSLLFIQLFYKLKISYKLKTEELINQRTTIINNEKHKLQQLLEAFVPREATAEIIATGKATYQRFEGVTVLFADIQGFSKIAETTDPEILIEQLDDLFYRYDFIVSKYGIEKIKTIGDAYMCAGGLPIKRSANAVEMVLAAMEMLDYIGHLTTQLNFSWKIRIGIHTGKVIAGVVGQKKLSYDIWGDTVNVANRMESSSVPGRINISGETYELVKDFFDCEYRGCIPIKNKGEKDMYFINGIHPWLTENRKPNAEFNLLIQLICLNDLAEIVLSKIDEEMPSNRYFHTADYIHHVYSNSISICKQTELSTEYQLVLQTASLFIFYGMIDHFDQFIEESIAFAKTILPEYNYNSTQINLICNTLSVINTLTPTNILESLLLENYYSCWGSVDFPERIKALYIEESELLDRLEWKDWLNLKIIQFERVIRSIDVDRAQFEINPYTQIQRLRYLKI